MFEQILDPVFIQHCNYYKSVPYNRWAFVEHVDSSIVTMLTQSGPDGLEVDYKGSWVKVPFKEDTFVVNLGNILEHATYGVVKGQFPFPI